MATLVLSAAGAAAGGALGGSVAGISTAVVGRAIGATVGQVIDQSLMGTGSEVIETGRVDRFRLSHTGEGEPVSQVYGRMRIGADARFVHAYARYGVIESALSAPWRRKIVARFGFPEEIS